MCGRCSELKSTEALRGGAQRYSDRCYVQQHSYALVQVIIEWTRAPSFTAFTQNRTGPSEVRWGGAELWPQSLSREPRQIASACPMNFLPQVTARHQSKSPSPDDSTLLPSPTSNTTSIAFSISYFFQNCTTTIHQEELTNTIHNNGYQRSLVRPVLGPQGRKSQLDPATPPQPLLTVTNLPFSFF